MDVDVASISQIQRGDIHIADVGAKGRMSDSVEIVEDVGDVAVENSLNHAKVRYDWKDVYLKLSEISRRRRSLITTGCRKSIEP